MSETDNRTLGDCVRDAVGGAQDEYESVWCSSIMATRRA
jgi:hypothetical protein